MLEINSGNLTYVVITLLVLFTIVYLYVYKNDTLEGFAQYNVNVGDTVTLSDLNNVVVASGTGNPVNLTNTINNMIDAKLTASTGTNTTNNLRLVGLINGSFPKLLWVSYIGNVNGTDYILGQDKANNLITSPISSFQTQRLTDATPNVSGTPDQRPNNKSIICFFDWINDKNIYRIQNTSGRNIVYTNVFPEKTDSAGKLISPFNESTLVPGATYLFNISYTKWWAYYYATYYVVFDASGYTLNKNIVLVNKHFVNLAEYHNTQYESFVVPTTSKTVNIGIYCIPLGSDQLTTDYNDDLSVTVYQILNPSATPTPTSTR